MHSFVQDLREAIRALARTPLFAIIGVVSLALGIGVNTAVFSFVNAVQFKKLPVEDEDTLVDVSEFSATELCDGCAVGTSYPAFRDWKGSARSFQALAAYRESRFIVSGGTGPARVGGAIVSANLFPAIGVQPVIGRTFVEQDDRPGAEPVVIVSDRLWRTRFGGMPVIGTSVKIDGRHRTIVGVMPPRFAFPEYADLWLPLVPEVGQWTRQDRSLAVIGRLDRQTTIDRARAEMRAVGAALAAAHVEPRQWTIEVTSLREDMTSETAMASTVLMTAVVFVLLIACANVANLLMVRTTNRRRELAIRAALGASRARLAQVVVTESMLLALAGGAAGMLFAVWASRVIAQMLGADAPYWIEFGVDGRVLLFALAATIITALLCGIAPVLQGSRADLQSAMRAGEREGAHRSGRTVRHVLAAGQLALALLLLAGAGLLIKTVIRTFQFDVGYDASRVLVGDVALPAARDADPASIVAFGREVIERLERIDGVRALVTRTVFFAGFGATPRLIAVEGMPQVPPTVSPGFYHAVSPGYFAALGLPLVEGREFTASDRGGVVVISQEMAHRLWPASTALGHRIRFGDAQSQAPWLTVVGVAANAGGSPIAWRRPIAAYVPFAAEPGTSLGIMLHTRGDPSSLAAELRAAVAAIDPDQPVEDIMTMEQALARWVQPARFVALLMTSLAGVALLMAAMGTFGVVAYAVSGRRREIGIRLAVGATPRQVEWLMARSGVYLAGAGLMTGLPAAAAATRTLEGILAGTSPTDPAVFAAVAVGLSGVTLIASWIPARRAGKVDPLIVLRAE